MSAARATLRRVDADAPPVSLPAAGVVSLGRDAANDIKLDDDGVSRNHAQISLGAEGIAVADAGSANGTYVERAGALLRAESAIPLVDGDIIRLGPVRFALRLDDALVTDPLHGRPWAREIHPPTVAAGFSMFAVGFFVWALPAVLASDIATTHGLSALEARILPATAIMFGAVARLSFGFVTDARGPLTAGTAALGIALAALALLAALGDTAIVAWLGVATLGVGLASLPIALPLVSQRTAPRRRGRALGIMAAGSVGIVVAALAGPALADALDWRSVFALALIPSTLGLAVFVYGARGAWVAPPARAWVPMARGPQLRVVAALFGITFGTFAGLYTVLPPVLRADAFGLSVSEGALVVAMGALAGSLARIAGGTAADRVGSHRVLLAVMAATTLLLAVAGNTGLALAIAMFIAAMGLFDAGTAAVLKLAAQSFGRTVGAGVGIISMVGGLFGFGVSLVASALFESTESAPLTFGVLAIAPALAGAWLWTIVRREHSVAAAAGPRLERLGAYGEVDETRPLAGALTIGRAAGNALCLPDDDYASRTHARLDLTDGVADLTDLGSTNGTMLWRDDDWQPVSRARLHDGDVIVIGSTVLRYRSGAA